MALHQKLVFSAMPLEQLSTYPYMFTAFTEPNIREVVNLQYSRQSSSKAEWDIIPPLNVDLHNHKYIPRRSWYKREDCLQTIIIELFEEKPS